MSTYKYLDDNGLTYYNSKIQAKLNNKLGASDTAYKTASIPYGECDSTSTATVFTATVPGITEPSTSTASGQSLYIATWPQLHATRRFGTLTTQCSSCMTPPASPVGAGFFIVVTTLTTTRLATSSARTPARSQPKKRATATAYGSHRQMGRAMCQSTPQRARPRRPQRH